MNTPLFPQAAFTSPALTDLPRLSTSQQAALDEVLHVYDAAPIIALQGPLGIGKTLILRTLQQRIPSVYIDIGQLVQQLSTTHPLALEEALHHLISTAFDQAELVLFDDLSGLENISRQQMANTRPHFLPLVLNTLFSRAHEEGKHIIFSIRDQQHIYEETLARSLRIHIPALTAKDYQQIVEHYLPSPSSHQIDFHKIQSDFKILNSYQLKTIAQLLAQTGEQAHSTEFVSSQLLKYLIHSNVDAGKQIEAISLDDLHGAEHIIEVLERTVLLPLLDTERAQALGLRPKRGVLLHGAPGTGKTSIGRALAHRMKGKFYMLDGTISSEPPGLFFYQLDTLFEAAQKNSPSVIFIDDADVLLKTDHVYGLNRYLLTKLDGLSEAAGDVCVIMTAMDIQDIPPPLLRSGRVEVWLETHLPDLATRTAILARYSRDLPSEFQDIDHTRLAHITAQFTPADLRRVISDAKGLLAYAQHTGHTINPFSDYLVQAALEIRDLKNNIARSLRGPEIPTTEYDLHSCGWA